MHRLAISTLFALSLVFAGTAAAASGWTPAQAAAKLKATYTAPDPIVAAVIQANIEQEKAACGCDTNARLIDMQAILEKTKTKAKASAASCKGVGRGASGRFSRFHCTVKVVDPDASMWPPDYQSYTATFKVTVRLPFRVTAGWR